MAQDQNNLIWIDLEMTGLDTQRDHIIEIATIVTTSQLEVVAEGPMLAIFQPESVLSTMDDWNTKQHGQSGLTARIRASTVTTADAEQQTLQFLRQYVPAGKSPMCGNSVCQDRRFLARLMPDLERFFHYRNLDVSTVKELTARWAPDVASQLNKKGSHLALDDIRESIEELRFYRSKVFKV